jgi:CHAT domain-containing protein
MFSGKPQDSRFGFTETRKTTTLFGVGLRVRPPVRRTGMAHARHISRAGLALLLASSGAQLALALTKEQALENCRNTVGRPFVMSCIRGGSNRAACKARVTSKVHDCIMKALDAANGRENVPVALPTEQAPTKEIEQQAEALPTTFIAPPRTITDITAILDSEKPDATKIAKLKAAADASVPSNASPVELAQFYNRRGNARSTLGRLHDAIDDANKALELGREAGDARLLGRLEQFAGLEFLLAGDPKEALEIFQEQVRTSEQKHAQGFLFGAVRHIVVILLQMGDMTQAEAYLQRSVKQINKARTSGLPGWRKSYARLGQSWESDVEFARGIVFEARGQYREAEKSYREAELRKRKIAEKISNTQNAAAVSKVSHVADILVLSQARAKVRQGRLAEAEADARRALLARLKAQGKYSPTTPKFIMGLVGALVEQGRYEESEKLVRVALEINRTLGVADDSMAMVAYSSRLASILNLEHKSGQAAAVFRQIDKAMVNWDPRLRENFDLSGSRISSLYAAGEVDKGIAAAKTRLKRNIARFGEKQYNTAMAHGTLGVGYMLAKRDKEAASEFRAAIPVLLAAAREGAANDNASVIAARSQRLRNFVESYITLLDRDRSGNGEKTAIETFALADAIRGHSVQQALAAASTRMAIKDPALAGLVREEQDLVKRVNAELGALNNALALPSGQRDENAVKALQTSIGNLRAERDKKRAEIAKQFPHYAELIDPKPPSVKEIKAILKPDEALLSFYFGRKSSFVWAVPKNGPVAFAAIHMRAGELESKVRDLRKALEPEASTILDVPPFDLNLAYTLYSLLLKPVEAGWKPAKKLIVVTNGALGQLPLSLLPTAPAKAADGDGPLFVGYRDVPWLARTHAVSTVPSAAALRTLRQVPRGSDKRKLLIGFGDPVFSKERMETEVHRGAAPTQVATTTMRGMPLKRRSTPKLEGVDSAELAQLPALPDTADELTAIARALGVDVTKALVMGAKANEETVKTTDLSHYKILVFATHGLVPGELNGLTQPALALSAPDIAGVKGDGLLTMEEIIALKLDADWVVLSACNTGAATGAGAEAASGLGSAFFYAGARALLVTNWSVDSQSARELTSELFRLQTAKPKLSRSEALRESMIALLDHKGFIGTDGKMAFAYAHPLFWAPYTIIGDGGM